MVARRTITAISTVVLILVCGWSLLFGLAAVKEVTGRRSEAKQSRRFLAMRPRGGETDNPAATNFELSAAPL